MKSECLPSHLAPHVTKLFTDFLSNEALVQRFYPRSPHLEQWLRDEAGLVQYDADRRERVCDILQSQNRSWNASTKTVENIARLRGGALALVTGQQVGLFGGPLFSTFKALTAAKLAALATQAGVDCVPIFWLATEDHDLAEVNQALIPGPDYSLQPFHAATNAPADAPVGTVRFGDEIDSVVQAITTLLGDSEAVTALRESYKPGETFGSAFAKLFARLLADLGVILLDASDQALHQVASPIYLAAIEKADELDEALLKRGEELEHSGYHQQVKVTPSSTLLFALQRGARIPIHRQSNGHGTEFTIGDVKITKADLLARIAAAPENFSANVLLRPVIQDYLLPTLAYTGGMAEVAYFAQAAVVYQALLGRITPIVPRFSATIIENKPRMLLDRYGLSYQDLFDGPEALRERIARTALPGEVQSAFENAKRSLDTSLAAIRASLAVLDKTLIDAADNAASKMQHQLESLQARAARAELRQSEIIDRKAQVLSNLLYPNKTQQEREIAGIYFVAKYGKELLDGLYETIRPDCLDHQVISI